MLSLTLKCNSQTFVATALRHFFIRHNVATVSKQWLTYHHASCTFGAYAQSTASQMIRNLSSFPSRDFGLQPDKSDAQSMGVLSVSVRPSPLRDVPHVVTKAHDPKRELAIYIGGSLVNIEAVNLYGMIRKMDTDEILSLVGHSLHELNETHLALSVKILHRLLTRTERQSSSFTSVQLLSDQRFQILCASLARKASLLEPSIVADMIAFLDKFGVSSTHPAMQVLIQLSMSQINNLALDQVATLSHVISGMETTRQTRLLMEAIKVLCQVRGDQQPVLTVNSKIQLLGVYGCELDYVDCLLRDLYRDRDDIHKWQQAVQFFVSVGKLWVKAVVQEKIPERHRRLEQWCLSILLRQLQWVDVDGLKALLVACQQLGVFHVELLQRIGQRAVDEVDFFDTNDQISVWSLLRNLGYYHSNLSSSVLGAAKNLDFRTISTTDKSTMCLLAIVAEAVSHDCDLRDFSAGQTSDRFAELKAGILDRLCDSQTNLLESESVGSLLDTCLYMFALNRQPPAEMTDHIMQNTASLLQSNTPSSYFGLHSSEKLKLLASTVIHLSPTNRRLVYELPPETRPKSTQVAAALQLSGLEAVHGVSAARGLYIDFLLPSGTSNESSTALLCWSNGRHFWRNTHRLQCLPLLYAKTLQRFSDHRVVVLNTSIWRRLGDREKLDYLAAAVTRQTDKITVI